jgi:NAD+ synthase (glutamine-hydrolysing)
MPGFATSSRTLEQAHALMEAIGCQASEIDIRPSCIQMLKDLGHPYSAGKEEYDITFENVQAGERTNHLFRLANFHNGIVIGTGDLSELALGWCTYGVGDHMSHYNVNASVPKTLIKHLVRWVADMGAIGLEGSNVLHAVVDTEISPARTPPRRKSRKTSSARTSCKTSRCIIFCATASRRRRWRSWPGRPGTTAPPAAGRTQKTLPSTTPMTSLRSSAT